MILGDHRVGGRPQGTRGGARYKSDHKIRGGGQDTRGGQAPPLLYTNAVGQPSIQILIVKRD